ncbi:hypothetical protein Glove_294g43 [Diversispora epigaea]|uniref:Uncharacterized protein n=1 Tax=Diversispora epigaea TaxID=1348612 RepID=A0A397I688_9GLOM|nr:hypothetical protein Glove_294g43 [Diversispora epigaea]
MTFKCPFCNCVLSSRSAYSQHVKRYSENYDSSSSEEIQNEFDIITPEQDDNSEDNRNNEIIYISDDEPMFSSRSNETSDIMQVEINELPQSMNSLTFEEFASIRYEEPASREPEFETDESKSKSDETETETESESKSDKTEFESDKTDNESDESEESESAEEETETIPKFPNNTYSDLMILIIQHNLNNKAGNAIIRFFNKHSNLPTSLLPKNIKERKLMDRMKLINLLNKEKTNNKITMSNTPPIGGHELKKLYQLNRFCINLKKSKYLKNPKSILGTCIIITWRRNKPDVKQLLAYLPIIKAKDDTQKISEEHKNIVRRTFHKSLKFLLSPLYDDNGIELELNNSIFWCFPRISMIISDWPEACTFALIYKSTKSNYPCHFCLVSKEDLSNINLNSNQIEPRSHNNMKLYYKNNTGKNVSIESVRNFFWSVPNKPDVKQLLAYLPIIKAKDDTQKISEEHKNIVRRTFHKSLKFLLSPLYDDNGIELELNNSIFWCFPRISMIISDWPEACTFALTYKSTKSNYPCHFCLVSKEDLSNINLNSNQIEPRSHNNMKLYYKNNTGKNVSIESVRNFFWSVPNINIYATTVPDRMHHLNLDLFQHQLNFTKILINKQCGKSVIDEMNNRVKLIHRYKDLKSFPNGFLHLTLLTVSEYRSLMKIMIFIVDKLYEDSESPNFIKNNKITEVYLKWNKMCSIFALQFVNLVPLMDSPQSHITESSSKEIPKTPIALKYSKKLYEFCIQNAEIYIQTRMNDPDLEKEMKLGFEKFLECLDVYLEIYYQNLSEHEKIDMIFHIYGGVTLKFGSIMRATNKFHKKPIFSNIAVEMNADEIFEYTSDNDSPQSHITESSSKEIPKTPIALKYSKKLYEFCIQNAEIYIQTRMNDPDLEKEMKLGFEKFLECLDVYLEIYYQNLSEHEKIDMIFHIYGGVTLKFGSIMRATNKFHKKPIFSNIAVEMNADEIFEYTSDNGVCFAQVLLIIEIIMNYEEPMHLALV